MDNLILRSIRGEISNVEERRLRNWRRASPDNERRYQQLSQVWQLALPDPDPDELPPRPAADHLVREAEVGRGRGGSLHYRLSSRAASWLPQGAAAATLILGIALAHSLLNRDTGPAFGVTEFATGSRESVTVTLTDGSFVRLAPNSRLRIGAVAGGRDVWLDGRGYFAVAPDTSRPFTVRTRFGEALVLGTRFEVRVEDDNLRLAVAEGRVALSAGAGKVEVRAGEVSYVQDGQRPSVVKVSDLSEILEWPGGLLVFQSTPLVQVVKELENHFGMPFEITDPVMAQRRVTGTFTDESLDEVVTAICRVTDADCSIDAESVTIAR